MRSIHLSYGRVEAQDRRLGGAVKVPRGEDLGRLRLPPGPLDPGRNDRSTRARPYLPNTRGRSTASSVSDA